jgi:hypothetical protein
VKRVLVIFTGTLLIFRFRCLSYIHVIHVDTGPQSGLSFFHEGRNHYQAQRDVALDNRDKETPIPPDIIKLL